MRFILLEFRIGFLNVIYVNFTIFNTTFAILFTLNFSQCSQCSSPSAIKFRSAIGGISLGFVSPRPPYPDSFQDRPDNGYRRLFSPSTKQPQHQAKYSLSSSAKAYVKMHASLPPLHLFAFSMPCFDTEATYFKRTA